MIKRLRIVIPSILCVALAMSACSKKEETPTFTGDKTEVPSYQANLDFVTPSAYSNVQGLTRTRDLYIYHRKRRECLILERSKKGCRAGGKGSEQDAWV